MPFLWVLIVEMKFVGLEYEKGKGCVGRSTSRDYQFSKGVKFKGLLQHLS